MSLSFSEKIPARSLMLAGCFIGAAWAPLHALTIESGFEGASVRGAQVDSSAQVVRFMPGGDPARGWPCWWHFQVKDMDPTKPLTLELSASDLPMPQAQGAPSAKPLSASWSMPERAAYSLDGKTWKQTEPGTKQNDVMTYRLETGASIVWVAWGPPYTPEQARAMVARIAKDHTTATDGELCKSREGRHVPMLHVLEKNAQMPDAKRPALWVQARQHAWESGASWVCEGFTEWLMGDEPGAVWLRQNCETFIVPIMDVDNTATGNGGKEALPQDHNRDWSAKPNWNEVAAAQSRIKRLVAEGRLDFFMDLHNPAPGDRKAFFFAGDPALMKPQLRENQALFFQLAGEHISPAMPMLDKPKITGQNYHPLWRQLSRNWVEANGNPQTLPVCLETPWNTEQSHVEGYKAVGAGLGRAMHAYMLQRPAGQAADGR